MPQSIGVDLHRRRSVTVPMTEAGEVLDKRRFENSTAAFAELVEAAGEHPEVVVEAAHGWYWVADLRPLQERQSVHRAIALASSSRSCDDRGGSCTA